VKAEGMEESEIPSGTVKIWHFWSVGKQKERKRERKRVS